MYPMLPLTGGKQLILFILALEFLNIWNSFSHFLTDLHFLLVPLKCHSDAFKKIPSSPWQLSENRISVFQQGLLKGTYKPLVDTSHLLHLSWRPWNFFTKWRACVIWKTLWFFSLSPFILCFLIYQGDNNFSFAVFNLAGGIRSC